MTTGRRLKYFCQHLGFIHCMVNLQFFWEMVFFVPMGLSVTVKNKFLNSLAQTKVIKKCCRSSKLRGMKMLHYFWKHDCGAQTFFRCFELAMWVWFFTNFQTHSQQSLCSGQDLFRSTLIWTLKRRLWNSQWYMEKHYELCLKILGSYINILFSKQPFRDFLTASVEWRRKVVFIDMEHSVSSFPWGRVGIGQCDSLIC